MKLKKVFGSFLMISLLCSCTPVQTEYPTHTPVTVADGYMTEDNELFVKYNGDNIEVIIGNVYTKYDVENPPLQLLPITESEFANEKYNFGNMYIDLDNKVVNCYVNENVTQHKLSKSDTALVPGIVDYWETLAFYEEQYPDCVIFPSVDRQFIIYDKEDSQLLIPKGEEMLLIDVENSFLPITYIQNASNAAQIKIDANRYLRENDIANVDVIFGTQSNQIGIVYDNKLLIITGGQ